MFRIIPKIGMPPCQVEEAPRLVVLQMAGDLKPRTVPQTLLFEIQTGVTFLPPTIPGSQLME